jgi:uncharacterized protein YjiS (DUF1127 family)
MSTIVASAGRSSGSRTVRLGQRVCAIGSAIARDWRARRDLAVLMAQGERMLHDIGVSRGEVEQAVLGYVR